ncbi:MAG: GTP cyclohydrolase I FolE [SAR324 cluster bacterium]|nr:GTP cyclohydrolase I FolE [SAR324 cluster bacterium]
MNKKQVEEGFRLVLDGLGVDLKSEHFKDSPHRIAKAWTNELASGLKNQNFKMTTFAVAKNYEPSMIVLQHIPVKSICAHHLLPFIGEATVAYIPNNRLCGLSKLSRVVDFFSRRPQVQENLTSDIARFLNENLVPQGVGVIIKASHMCMEMRGVNHQGMMTTCSLLGCFMDDGVVRNEFMALAQSNAPLKI